jgi:hypothetical protein
MNTRRRTVLTLLLFPLLLVGAGASAAPPGGAGQPSQFAVPPLPVQNYAVIDLSGSTITTQPIKTVALDESNNVAFAYSVGDAEVLDAQGHPDTIPATDAYAYKWVNGSATLSAHTTQTSSGPGGVTYNRSMYFTPAYNLLNLDALGCIYLGVLAQQTSNDANGNPVTSTLWSALCQISGDVANPPYSETPLSPPDPPLNDGGLTDNFFFLNPDGGNANAYCVGAVGGINVTNGYCQLIYSQGSFTIFDFTDDIGIPPTVTGNNAISEADFWPTMCNAHGQAIDNIDDLLWDGTGVQTPPSRPVALNDQGDVICTADVCANGATQNTNTTLAGKVPAPYASEIQNLAGVAVGDRNTAATGQQPLLNLVASGNIDRSGKGTSWQPTQFLFQELADSTWTMGEISNSAGLQIKAINSSGVIVAIGNPPGNTNPIPVQHALLLLPAQVTSVSFLNLGVPYANNCWQLESDDGTTQYASPQWLDQNGKAGTPGWDATAADPSEHDNAVAFTRNTNPAIGAKFKIAGASHWSSLKFKATGSDGINIPATAGTIDPTDPTGTTVIMPATRSTTAFPNTIKYYNKADGTAFTLNWSISVDGGTTWVAINSTKHTVYVTLGDPQTSATQETVFYLGCKNQGTQTDPATVANTIFNEFTSLKVCRVGTTTGLQYWGAWASSAAAQTANPDCFHTAGLLKNGDGRCGAWARFLYDVFAAQGLSGVQIEDIEPIAPAGYTGEYIFVKNWNLTDLSSPVDLPGIPGQSNPNPPSYFSSPGAHAMVGFSGALYDPSYGAKYSGASMDANRQAWEDAALAAIAIEDSAGNSYIQPHTAGVQQTTMTPVSY